MSTAMRLRPSVLGFARRYALAATPLVANALAHVGRGYLEPIAPWLAPTLPTLAPALTAAALLVAWVLRSPEAAASAALALLLPILALEPGVEFHRAVARYLELFPSFALVSSLLVVLGVEARRRSISYEVGTAGMAIKAGIWRRQEQTIPYSAIGRIVLEQSLIGKLFDYGTIIVVSSAEWGAEYYTRGVGGGVGRGGASLQVFYARTLKEVSRDPGKCLYGIKRPRAVKEEIEARIAALS